MSFTFFKKLAPWMAVGAQFIPGAGPVIAGTITQIAKDHNVPLPSGEVQPTVDSISEAAAALTGNANALAALKTAEQDYMAKMQAAGFQHEDDIEKMFLDDKASARDREVQLARANARDYIPAILAITVTIGFFSTLWFVFAHGVKAESHDLAIGMVNVLGTAWVGIIAYYFGSSKGSDDKTKIIGDIAKS